MKILKEYCFTDYLLLTAIILLGGFNEFVSCFLSVLMSAYLIYKIRKEKKLVIGKNLQSLFIMMIPLLYGISCLWAVDRGMALIGFLKFLPVGLFALSLWQTESNGKILNAFPVIASVLTVISVLLMQFEALSGLFSVSGRFAGIFRYPNTYALFLLACQLIILQKNELKVIDYGIMAVLVGGLIYTGSRTALIIFVISNIAYILLCGNKKLKIGLFVLILAVVAVIAAAILIGGKDSIFYRYLLISFESSTFIGRLLYFVDALPLLLKYPFGMGYMGYYYMQGQVQSGVYAVAFVHNDFLQLILDIGIIPGILFITVLVRWFIKKDISTGRKITVGAICLHSLLEFNLQFIAIFMLLILLIHSPQENAVILRRGNIAVSIVLAVFSAVSIYIGTSLFLVYAGQWETADKLYPYNTQNKLAILGKTEDLSEANSISDEILNINTKYYLPYSVKAKFAYSKGKFSEVIEYKRKAIESYCFKYDEYTEYCQMLINGIEAYERAGDTASAEVCKKELISTADLFDSNKQRLSRLGSMIENQPWAYLPDEITKYIEQIK